MPTMQPFTVSESVCDPVGTLFNMVTRDADAPTLPPRGLRRLGLRSTRNSANGQGARGGLWPRSDHPMRIGAGPDGWVAGIDLSREMVEQACIRNAPAIREGRVDLRYGSVASLPFRDGGFDKALAINSMQLWPDASAGLLEMRRVLKPGAGLPSDSLVIPARSRPGWTTRLARPTLRMRDLRELNRPGFAGGRFV